MSQVETRSLQPLDPAEIARACALLRAHPDVPEGARVVWASVDEGVKGQARHRGAEVSLYHRPTRMALRARVDLEADEVLGVVEHPGMQPSIIYEEYRLAGEVAKADPGFRAALARRGITEEMLDHVQVDPWATGNFGLEWEEGRRIVRAVPLWRDEPDDNGYAHPIENIIAYVDLNEARVVKLEDFGVVPIPADTGAYKAEKNQPWREALKPLEVVQEEGPGFALDGHALTWANWSLTAMQHPVDGLVLHDIAWVEDDGRVRPLIRRASLAEMVVPYGDTHPCHGFKHVLDCGEYGFGPMANSLTLGCDCLGEIRYLDAHFADPDGESMTTANAICIHEEDFGILWKHFDHFTGLTEVRRSRRLVVSSIHTVGNYEYGIFWYFYLDGSIQLELKLSGIVNTMAIEEGAPVPYARRIGRQLAAPHHQHLFSFRLDMDVDGERNTVYEIDSVAEPLGPDNPYGSAFVAHETPIRRESEGVRDADPSRSRYWEIRNDGVKNAYGDSVGYRLKLGHGTARMLAHPESQVSRRAEFARHNLWVTRYHPDERKAAGDYPNQHAGGDGLPVFVAQDRPLEDEDVVVWVTIGTTHISRPEDFPVMPVEYLGFMLQPCGFFDRNPAMNLPPISNRHHCC